LIDIDAGGTKHRMAGQILGNSVPPPKAEDTYKAKSPIRIPIPLLLGTCTCSMIEPLVKSKNLGRLSLTVTAASAISETCTSRRHGIRGKWKAADRVHRVITAV
jgi:hypothetical protein